MAYPTDLKRRILRAGGLTLAAVTAFAHILVGTYDTLLPLLKSDLPPMVRGTFHACWHFVSLFLATSVWCFFTKHACEKELALLWVGFAICFVAVGIGVSGISGLLILPQWIFLSAAGVLLFLTAEVRTPRQPE